MQNLVALSKNAQHVTVLGIFIEKNKARKRRESLSHPSKIYGKVAAPPL